MLFISANPRTIDNESNDCTVRATALATEKDYKEIHEVYKKRGRANGRGVPLNVIGSVIADIVEDISVLNFINKPPTLSQFIKDNPTGNWVITRRGHAFAVKNGIVYDAHKSQAGARCRVLMAFKVK